MALVIEDGTARADSTSYATVVELRGYAAVRGATVPTADAACEVLLIKAMDRMSSATLLELGQSYVGERATKEQACDWPRIGSDVYVECWPIGPREIPRQLVQAQSAYAIEAQTVDLMPTQLVNQKGAVVGESVAGVVSRTYANNGRVLRVPAIAKADALLRTLLRRSGLFAVRA